MSAGTPEPTASPGNARQPSRLRRGDLLPRMVVPPPGPRARQLSAQLAELEAPGINTLAGDQPNLLWREARGVNVQDVDGNRYLDLTAGFGVAAIGHRHPRVHAALTAQSRLLVHGLGDAMGHELRIALAERLRALAPCAHAQVYYAISGADAVEIALKTACLHTGKPGVLVFAPSYHGLTLGALGASSRPAFRAPFAAQLNRHLARLPFGCDPARIERRLRRSAATLGALLVEPIVGREGVLLPPPGWLREVANLCRRTQTLFIVDEILTGFGRTGATFAVEHEGVSPDLLCCGKALGGGLPIAAVLGPKTCFRCWLTPGEARHTATFVAHPLACAAALATLAVIADEDLPQHAQRLGSEVVAPLLATWPARFHPVVACRGRGLLWGVELTSAATAHALVLRARDHGLLLLAGGPDGRVVQILPPLVISERLLRSALERLEQVLLGLAQSDSDPAPDRGSARRRKP